MKIKDLPKDLQKLALINQDVQGKLCDIDERIDLAFNWEMSPQGRSFWADIFYNNDSNEPKKPTQYKIGIDTFERAKANLTKEELLACCRFNIDKYTWRKKDQDKSDFEKIIAYATYAIENGF